MKKAIEILQEKVTEAAFYLDLDEANVIVAAMEEYAEQQLKNCNLQSVSNNEVAVCDCNKGKFVFNEVKQELICGCGRRIRITN